GYPLVDEDQEANEVDEPKQPQDGEASERIRLVHDVEGTGGSLRPRRQFLILLGVRLLTRAIVSMFLLVAPARTWADSSSSEPDFYSLKSWAPVGTWDYVAVALGNAAIITISATIHPPTRWQGGILFDDWARNGLRLSSESARNTAHTASSVLAIVAGIYPLLIDAGVLTGWIHRRPDLGWQMFIVDAEVLTLTGVLTTATSHVVGRERPSMMNENDSFFSGHEAISASAATLICLQHLQLGLFGNKAADATACGIGIAAGVSDGLLRIMADRHWASDVIVRAAGGNWAAIPFFNPQGEPHPAGPIALPI